MLACLLAQCYLNCFGCADQMFFFYVWNSRPPAEPVLLVLIAIQPKRPFGEGTKTEIQFAMLVDYIGNSTL